MKKIFTLIIQVIICSCFNSSFGQCVASISGDTCTTATLTANFSGDVANKIEWYRDGILEQIRGKRNPNSVVVAGGGSTDASQLYGPQDVAVDKKGNIYVVDDGRQRVQKWMPGASEGVTVAGGNGKGKELNQFFTPRGIAVDEAGNVYVSDDLMARVTKWAPGATAGVVVAGGNGEGSAANQLAGTQNICLDKYGNLYIADRWNDRIQKWAPGAVTGVTVAGGNGRGSAANQLTEPFDVAVDTSGNVYVVDYANPRVQKWAPGAVSGVTVAGGNGIGSAAGQLNFTTAISITNSGVLYVRDAGNYRIQKWIPGASNGITVAGGNGPGDASANKVSSGFGLFVDKSENIYVPELFENVVKKFIKASTVDTQFTAVLAGGYKAKIKGENGCSVKSGLVHVLMVPLKPDRIYGRAHVSASDDNLVYKVDKIYGNDYTWTVPPDAQIVSGQGSSSITVNWGTSSDYVSVIAHNTCGISKLRRKIVYVNSLIALNSDIVAENTRPGIYPNPVIANATVFFKADKPSTYNLLVTDIKGKIFIERKGAVVSGNNTIIIPVDKLMPGNYFVKLTDENNGNQNISFVKQ